MIVFVAIFVSFALISTVLKLSLTENRSLQIAGIAIISVFCLAIYPFSVRQNNQFFFEILQSRNIIHGIAALQILESVLMIGMSLQTIKGHFSESLKPFVAILSLVPSFVLLSGLFLAQIFVYLKITGISFGMTALLYALSAGFIIWLLTFAAGFMARQWELRAELNILVHFFQILLAMFLPLIVDGIKLPFSQFVFDPFSIMVILLIVLFFGLLGVMEFKYLRKRI